MKLLTRLAILGSALVCGTFVSEAAMIYDIKLYNSSGRSVELVEKNRRGATIPAGGSKTFAYYGGVFLRVSGREISYKRVDPPAEYISAGLFSVSFKAQLAPDLRIYLIPPAAPLPARLLPVQPKGFPLVPVSRTTNQLQPKS